MARVADPFSNTATGVLGDKRDTMLHNELHLRDELGRSMTRGYTQYPGVEFTYGRQYPKRDGGVPEAVRGWGTNVCQSFPLPKSGVNKEKDFAALNKAALAQGITTAGEMYTYRATHDIRRTVKEPGEATQFKPRRIPPSMVFGIASRPSTPIHELLEHRYQDKWIGDRTAKNDYEKKVEHELRLAANKFGDTRTAILRAHQVKVPEGPSWQMTKFSKKALPNIDTFRSKSARNSAYKQYKSESAARRGPLQQGIYESAKS